MLKTKGKLIVFEGIDGTGKYTQSNSLYKSLTLLGYNVMLLHFPSYNETFFGKEVANYLNGKFGGLTDIDPKLAAILYAGDRFEKRKIITKFLGKEENIILCDRYIPSNIAHHAVKLKKNEYGNFKKWVEKLEYEVFKLPVPNLIILLDLLPELSTKQVLKKNKRIYTTKKQDLHEIDQNYLSKVYKVFLLLSNEQNWIRIKCYLENYQIRTIEDISREIYKYVLEFINK